MTHGILLRCIFNVYIIWIELQIGSCTCPCVEYSKSAGFHFPFCLLVMIPLLALKILSKTQDAEVALGACTEIEFGHNISLTYF